MKKPANKVYCFRYLIFVTLFLMIGLRLGLWWIESTYKDQVDLVTNFPVSSQVFDRNGVLLYEYFGDIRRMPVDPDQIPDHLLAATLMAEDERFFLHPGFDPLGIVRAFWKNLRADGIVEGGSTLGQQLVKNTILGPADGYSGKIEEILLSTAIDARFTKDTIFHLYINTIPYGSNVYGAEAASRHYFGKHSFELSVAESATLAALPKHPTYLSPYGDHLDELIERRDWILEKMYKEGFIEEIEYTTALTDHLTFQEPEVSILAPHFVMYVREELESVLGKERVEQGGLRIQTTLDYSLNLKGEQSVKEHQDLRDRYWADSTGLLALNPQNGEILAMVGNVDYFDDTEAGNVNMTIAKRQPGSSFKPLVYAALLDQEMVTPATVLWDVQKNFSTTDEPYIPKNYDLKYRGPVTVRSALAQSLNVPAVQALMMVGIDDALDLAEDMGIQTLEERNRFGPSLVLGGAEVTLVDLVSAYGTFANQGAHIAPTSILQISTLDGGTIDWRTSLPRQVIRPETAYQITSVLSDNHSRAPVFGMRSSLAFTDHQVAAKTGTTQAYRDAWTVGYTPELAAGVWVGNHDNEPLRYGAAGALAASPVWRTFLDKYLEDREPLEFVQPDYLEEATVYTALGPRTELIAPWQVDARQQSLAKKAYSDRLKAMRVEPKEDLSSTSS